MATLLKLRELSKKYRRWQKLEKFIDKIELIYESDLESAISNSNTLLETIFRTILAERITKYQEDEKLLKELKLSPLVTQTLKNINLVKSDENSKFIIATMTAIKCLGEIRNDFSHGKNLAATQESSLEDLTALFLISSVENISCFLIEFYEVEYPLKGRKKKIEYEDLSDFNNWLDDKHEPVNVADVSILASSALFSDLIAYQEKYQIYLSAKHEEINRG